MYIHAGRPRVRGGQTYRHESKWHRDRALLSAASWTGANPEEVVPTHETLQRYAAIGSALIGAKAMETVMPWLEFTESVAEAEKLTRHGDFETDSRPLGRNPPAPYYRGSRRRHGFFDASETGRLPEANRLGRCFA